MLYFFRGDGYYEQFKENRWLFEYDLPPVVLPDGSTVARTDLVRRRTVDEWDAGWVPEVTRTSGDWTVTVGGEARLHEAHHLGDVRWAEHYPDGVDPNHRYYDYRVEKRTFALQATAAWRASDRLSITGRTAGHVPPLRDARRQGQRRLVRRELHLRAAARWAPSSPSARAPRRTPTSRAA